jgi:hypothetical protein
VPPSSDWPTWLATRKTRGGLTPFLQYRTRRLAKRSLREDGDRTRVCHVRRYSPDRLVQGGGYWCRRVRSGCLIVASAIEVDDSISWRTEKLSSIGVVTSNQ